MGSESYPAPRKIKAWCVNKEGRSGFPWWSPDPGGYK